MRNNANILIATHKLLENHEPIFAAKWTSTWHVCVLDVSGSISTLIPAFFTQVLMVVFSLSTLIQNIIPGFDQPSTLFTVCSRPAILCCMTYAVQRSYYVTNSQYCDMCLLPRAILALIRYSLFRSVEKLL